MGWRWWNVFNCHPVHVVLETISWQGSVINNYHWDVVYDFLDQHGIGCKNYYSTGDDIFGGRNCSDCINLCIYEKLINLSN